jgi:nicotinate-nucleotide adenylyltransferase
VSRPVGVFGGTFNPPHNGHLGLICSAMGHFGCSRLVVMVAGRPPHKEVDLDAETRFRLAEAAFADEPGVEMSRHDLERPGYAYTADTAAWAAREWGDVVFLVGADGFADFLEWHEPNVILEHVRLGVATRPGVARDRLEPVLRALVRPDRVEFFDIPPVDLSSRTLRERVAAGEPIDPFVPARVAALVREHDLYRR